MHVNSLINSTFTSRSPCFQFSAFKSIVDHLCRKSFFIFTGISLHSGFWQSTVLKRRFYAKTDSLLFLISAVERYDWYFYQSLPVSHMQAIFHLLIYRAAESASFSASMDTNPPDHTRTWEHFRLQSPASLSEILIHCSTLCPCISVTPASKGKFISGIRPTDKIRVSQLWSSSVQGSASCVHLLLKRSHRSNAYSFCNLTQANTMGYCNHLRPVQYFLEDRLDMAGSQKPPLQAPFLGQSLRAMMHSISPEPKITTSFARHTVIKGSYMPVQHLL